MYAKLACLILFSYSDPIYGILFAAVSLLHLLLLPEPVYQGPEHVTYFRADEFEKELTRDRRVVYLIEMYAAWNPVSVDFASCFAELSARSVPCPLPVRRSHLSAAIRWTIFALGK